jgi:hypothetical protein
MPPGRRANLGVAAALAALLLAGCENLPAEQGGLFTGVGAKLAAATIVTDPGSHPVSTLLDGALGFGGGYLVGVSPDKLDDANKSRYREEALRANDRAERNPADVEDVAAASTADLNADGFVTVDEIVAMEQAGLTDEQEIARLRAAGQLYELSAQQERYLEDRGISLAVVQAIRALQHHSSAPEVAAPLGS